MLLQNIIDDIEKYPFSNVEIQKMLNDNSVKVVDYDVFDTVLDLDDFFDNSDACILLLQRKQINVGHWVCLLYNKEKMKMEYFSSYGKSLLEELKYASDDSKALYYLINKKIAIGWQYDENGYVLQLMSRKTATCGLHCCLRVVFRHLTNDIYGKMIKDWAKKHSLSTDDTVISLMASDVITVLRRRPLEWV
jgi:hypothetical protein